MCLCGTRYSIEAAHASLYLDYREWHVRAQLVAKVR